ncbi:MAG TPA: hypothetical protein VLF41_02540 [Candidatus Nanoarchaeia archaeon]|nr:hypothetical protein [Candidatus Nanoarchaeia archaeon]
MNKLMAKAAGIGFLTVSLTQFAFAANGVPDELQNGVNAAQPSGASSCLFAVPGSGCTTSIFQTVANTLIFIVGAIAVIMLIVGGLRYVLSSGDQAAVTGAKNTILYAIIGIIVAILAFAAVNFVVQQFSKSS